MIRLTKFQLIVLVFIFITVFIDGLRDYNYGRHWIYWHGLKWIQMYGLWLFVLWQNGMFNPKKFKRQWFLWIALAVIGKILWNWGAMVQLPPRTINSIGF